MSDNFDTIKIMQMPRLLQSGSTYIAKCEQCNFGFSAPAPDLPTFINYHLSIATEFRLVDGVWQCGHCHSVGDDLIEIIQRPSYRLYEGDYPAWVIVDTRGPNWIIETWLRDVDAKSKINAIAQVADLNEYEGYNRWILIRTSSSPKSLRRNPECFCDVCYGI